MVFTLTSHLRTHYDYSYSLKSYWNPCPDGLTAEFFETFKEELYANLVKLVERNKHPVNRRSTSRSLFQSQCHSNIKTR